MQYFLMFCLLGNRKVKTIQAMKGFKFYVGALLAGVSSVFQSCDSDDGFALGDIGRDWVTVHVEGTGAYSFTGDTWGTMWPAATAIWGYRPVEGQRAILYFNPLYENFQSYDYGIKPEYIFDILTKSVEELTQENEVEYGNDPAYISDAWIGGGYLNLVFAQHVPQKEAHRVSLVRTTEELTDDGYIQLEYRYNTYGDTLDVRMIEGAVSYNLNTLDLKNAKGIKLKLNDAVKGNREMTFTRMDEDTPESAQELDFSEMNAR